ncbi:hypothetical protein [Spirosoma koreense]
MQRRVNPWVVLLTAALTFGSLMAFVGPRSFSRHWVGYGYYRHHGHYGPHGWYGNGGCGDQSTDRRAGQSPVKPDTNSFQ